MACRILLADAWHPTIVHGLQSGVIAGGRKLFASLERQKNIPPSLDKLRAFKI